MLQRGEVKGIKGAHGRGTPSSPRGWWEKLRWGSSVPAETQRMTEIVPMMCTWVWMRVRMHTHVHTHVHPPGKCMLQVERTARASPELSVRTAHPRNAKRLPPPGKQQVIHSFNKCLLPASGAPWDSLVWQPLCWASFGSQSFRKELPHFLGFLAVS